MWLNSCWVKAGFSPEEQREFLQICKSPHRCSTWNKYLERVTQTGKKILLWMLKKGRWTPMKHKISHHQSTTTGLCLASSTSIRNILTLIHVLIHFHFVCKAQSWRGSSAELQFSKAALAHSLSVTSSGLSNPARSCIEMGCVSCLRKQYSNWERSTSNRLWISGETQTESIWMRLHIWIQAVGIQKWERRTFHMCTSHHIRRDGGEVFGFLPVVPAREVLIWDTENQFFLFLTKQEQDLILLREFHTYWNILKELYEHLLAVPLLLMHLKEVSLFPTKNPSW